MAETDQTTNEVLDSLTGHEEMWIADQFGRSIGEMVEGFMSRNDVGPYYRALIFALKRREGLSDDDARNAVLDMKLGDVVAYFPTESSVVEESGKDEPEDTLQPEPSLSSVS